MVILGVKTSGRVDDESDFVEFSICEVNYINLYRPRKNSEQIPVYHTSYGSFAPLLTLRDLHVALTPRGFHYIDQSTLVNGNRVIRKERLEEGLKLIFVDLSELYVSKKSNK